MAQFLKDEVRDNIKQSAVVVFSDKGFKKASIKEIAEVAGVSVGNVYRYYKSKEDLYSSVIEGVYRGVKEIMHSVKNNAPYDELYKNGTLEKDIYQPMNDFIQLYRREKPAFAILLSGEKGEHYEKTIVQFIDMLREYFIGLWGEGSNVGDMSFVEASAFTNAIVFAVIDMLNNVEDDDLESTLKGFVTRMVYGYFYIRKVEKDED